MRELCTCSTDVCMCVYIKTCVYVSSLLPGWALVAMARLDAAGDWRGAFEVVMWFKAGLKGELVMLEGG